MYSAWQFFRPRHGHHPTYQPPVTVLKPLKGLDIKLYDNLVSLCRQNYPTVQIICGVADTQDPAAAPSDRWWPTIAVVMCSFQVFHASPPTWKSASVPMCQ